MTVRTYAGPPCPRGHDGTRYTASTACVACVSGHAAVADAQHLALRIDNAPADRFEREVVARAIASPHPDALAVMGEAMLAARYPSLVGHKSMRSDRAGRYLMHPDDEQALRALAG